MLDYALVVKKLSKQFEYKGQTQTLFDQLSFKLLPQRILAVLGPSGCGKSTLLKILAGLTSYQSGIICWTESLTPIKLGYIPQTPSLMPNLTILKNCLFLAPFSTALQNNKNTVETLLKKVGLEDFVHHYPTQISGGMQQKVALIRALLLDPDILLMDEPFSAIDEIARWQCDFDLVQLVNTKSTTIIFVTHNVEEAVAIADRVICFSADKPTQIIGDVDIQFSTPRNHTLLHSAEYWEKVRQLRNLVAKNYANA